MLKLVNEDLEDILEKTNALRQELKYDCEKTWDLLSPPGSLSRGSFVIDKNTNPSSIRERVSEISNNSHLEGDSAFSDVSELIAYGKQIRDTLKQGSKKNCTSSKDSTTKNETVNQNKEGKCVSKYSSTKTSVTSKKVDKNSKSIQTAKTQAQTNKLNQEKVMGRHLNNCEENTEGRNKIRHTNETEHNNEAKEQTCTPVYSHLCALTLSDILKNLKMPEELQHLLKHYYNYKYNKFQNNPRDKENRNYFGMRFAQLTRLQLERNIKTSIKNVDKFKKYLDIAGEVHPEDTKTTSNELYPVVQFNSKEQLALYESKLHLLFELKLQERLLDKVSVLYSSVK